MTWWVDLAASLWPKSQWNDQVRELWRDRLRNVEPQLLKNAIQQVRCDRSSERVEIGWVLAEVSRVRANQREAMRQQERSQDREDPDARTAREETEVTCEDIRRRRTLSTLPEEKLEKIRTWLRGLWSGCRCSGPPSEWSRIAVGLAAANGALWDSPSTPSPRPSPDPAPSCEEEGSACTDPRTQASSVPPSESPLALLEAADHQSWDPAGFF